MPRPIPDSLGGSSAGRVVVAELAAVLRIDLEFERAVGMKVTIYNPKLDAAESPTVLFPATGKDRMHDLDKLF
jgi:hypothetical protein